jgi:hypothetical protein
LCGRRVGGTIILKMAAHVSAQVTSVEIVTMTGIINTVYTISGVQCCDHILSAGFVTHKEDCEKLALRHYLEHIEDDDTEVTVVADTENNKVTIIDEYGFPETFYIQTIKRLV